MPEPTGDDPLLEAVRLMGRIRREGDWEAAQTHESLLAFLVEETWELVDAVAAGDRAEMRSELGDLLLQVLFHAAIAAEDPDDPFDVRDVARALLDKLRRRAPYWFTGEEGAPDAEEQGRLWQAAKRVERGEERPRGVLEGVSWRQPALSLGQQVLARARAAGVPADLVPAALTTVRVGDDETSAELAYRAAVRAFADDLRAAEAAPGAWREAWPRRD